MTDMTKTNESNSQIADKLEDTALIFSMLDKNNLIETLQTIDKELTHIDTLSQEHNATALRAISHWMGLNLELTDDTKTQIETLLHDGSFANWVDILASVLRKHDPVLLPQLHQSFTTPQWPIKPSAPLLKGIAIWVEEARKAQQTNDVNSEDSSVTHLEKDNIEQKTPTQYSAESSEDNSEEFEPKHVFEEIDPSILNKDYNYCTDAVLKELKEHPDFKVSLIEVDKKGLSDDQEQNDNIDQDLQETELDDQLQSDQSMFAMEVDDIVMTLSATSSNSTTPLENIEPYLKELSRLTQLAEISNHEGVSHASDWCQRNVKLFNENQNEGVEHFVKTGECWSWIELINICLSEPEEVCHLATLTTAFKREEWLEPFEEDALQSLLLELKQDSDENSESDDFCDSLEADNSTFLSEHEKSGRELLEASALLGTDIISNKENHETIEEKSYETSGLETKWNDDIHPELLSVYLEETPEQITKLTPLLLAISQNSANSDEKYTAARMAHTIKGGSAVVGITILSEYAYKLETLLDFSVDNSLPKDLLEMLPEAASCLEVLFDAVQSKNKEPQEFLEIFNKLSHYVENLDEYRSTNAKLDNEEEQLADLPPSALPDFIQNQNALSDSLEKNIEEDLEAAITLIEQETLSDTENEVEALAETLEEIKLPDETPNILERIDSHEDEASLDNTNEMSLEIDDIVMTLASITATSEDVLENTTSYIAELDRFDILAEISGYPALSKLSQWCQTNLTDFASSPSNDIKQFIATGECWAWLEHLGICLNQPNEPSNLSLLATEIMREEWTQAFDLTELQNVLLAIRNEDSSADDNGLDDNNLEGVSTELETTALEITENPNNPNNEITADKLPKELNVDKSIKTNQKEKNTQKNKQTNETTDKSKPKTSDDCVETQNINEVISWDEDIHPELLSTYFQETPDQIAELAGLLHKIANKKAKKADYKNASRIAHTVKGSSGVVGLTSLVELTHSLEDILDYSVNNELPQDTAEFLAETSDCLESLFETIQNKHEAPEEFTPVVKQLNLYAEQLSTANSSNEGEIELSTPDLPDFIDKRSTDDSSAVVNSTDESTEVSSPTQALDTNASVSETHIRVPVEIIDKLLNLAGELVTTSTKVSDQLKQTELTNKASQVQDIRVHKMLDELSNTIYQQDKDQQKMLSSLQNSNFDTLEMDTYNELHSVTGLLTESILDSEAIEKNLSNQLSNIQEDLRSLDKLNKELSDVILSSRMVSINTLIPRLERIVRQTCRKTGKKAELVVTGNDINIDTDILNGLVDPLLHLLRNAIDHGIETPKDRKAKKKDDVGIIQLDFSREGNQILMQLKDDGAGIDPEFIYKRAIDKAIITPDQEFSTSDTLKLILHPGFSTQEGVSEVSGRGVGMDVVNTSIENLKGDLQIKSEKNQGTRFNVRIPLTLITNTTLLVNASDNPVAIASENIDQILYLSPDQVIQKKGQYYVNHEDKELLIHSLSELLNWQTEDIDFSKPHTLLLIKDGNQLQAVQIEEIVYSREVVVKSLEPWVDSNKGITGACHLNDGGVAPVINLASVLNNFANNTTSKKRNTIKTQTSEKKEKIVQKTTLKILVVDDSLSNRKALSLIIEQTDYEVFTAVDGLDALQVMNDNNIDMVFTDLEMPRMNGLEFTQAIRAWNDKKDTPVVMITSRTTGKHRNLAVKAGVDDYLTKPVVTETLLESINTWLKQKETTE